MNLYDSSQLEAHQKFSEVNCSCRNDRIMNKKAYFFLSTTLVLTLLSSLAVVGWVEFLPPVSSDSTPLQSIGPDEIPSPESVSPSPIAGTLDEGETLYDILKEFDIPDDEILSMISATRNVFNMKKLKAGQNYEIAFRRDGHPKKFEYEINPQEALLLSHTQEGWTAGIQPIEYQTAHRVLQGVIQESLYISLENLCAFPKLAPLLADIFAWDIDFGLDIREGDAYSILYEELWRKNTLTGPGRILAARFINQGEPYEAVYYQSQDGNGNYYTPQGHSLQKQFLKSPLRYKYISSSYSKNRLHPILKIRRPHLGVDFAAPYGTPVRAAADGTVVFKGRKGGMGHMIKVRHNSKYSTAYGHLSRYAEGLKRGKKVKQGDIIGYVGSTGLSTGPHLHYSFYRHAKLVNPLGVENPRAKSILPSERRAFKAHAETLLSQIQPGRFKNLKTSESFSSL